jgi:hypothetical protein
VTETKREQRATGVYLLSGALPSGFTFRPFWILSDRYARAGQLLIAARELNIHLEDGKIEHPASGRYLGA